MDNPLKNDAVVELQHGQVAIFGYGSLLSRASRERTIGPCYSGPFFTCSVRGWRRSWDVADPNNTFYGLEIRDGEDEAQRYVPAGIIYLNVTRDAGMSVNGVVFVIEGDVLGALDIRERAYDRVRVDEDLLGVSVVGGPAYMYVAKPEFLVRDIRSVRVAAVRNTYIQVVETGIAELGEIFRDQYLVSSDVPPPELCFDDFCDAWNT